MNFRTMKNLFLTLSLSFFCFSLFSQYKFYDETKDVLIYENDDLSIEKVVFYKDPIFIYDYKLMSEKNIPDWFSYFLFIINPKASETSKLIFDNYASKDFILEKKVSSYDEYVEVTESKIKPPFDFHKFIYIHLELKLYNKSEDKFFSLYILELSENEIEDNFYGYKNLDVTKNVLINPFVLEIKHERFEVPHSDAYDIFFPYSKYVFGYNNNLQKLLDAVPSYIESSKNADGIRVEKVVVNE